MSDLCLIDYGAGNIRSITNALRALGVAPERVTTSHELPDSAKRLVVPGVGAFGSAMENLRARGLVEPIKRHVAAGRPLLGICVGYQILFEVGEELGQHEGLGIIPGRVRRFQNDALIVPHMGWNMVSFRTSQHPMLTHFPAEEHLYFVHSFFPDQVPDAWVAATTTYDETFVSGVARDNVVGFQFHPEKSGTAGLGLLDQWLAVTQT